MIWWCIYSYAYGVNPDAVGLRGDATNTAVVTVNGESVQRDTIATDHVPWHFALEADNANGPDFSFAEITAVVNPPGTNTPDIVSTSSGHLYAPPQNETLAYDADGNLLSDGRWQYTWNGENRLIKAVELVSPTNRQPYTVKYAYDHQGRMVWKEISRRGAEAQSWEVEQTASILWDGYNIVQALSHSQTHTLTNFHIWGLDLSGSLQGAGGVGGLLAEVHDGEPYYAAYDANGNVTEYLTTDGTIAAHYEYSPFGEIVVQSGDLADSFTHRFSTKPCCAVTGLSEYEYRKYSPSVGRWMSRDPNTETSSEPHLTTIVKNSSVNRIDHLGKYSIGQVEIGNGSFEGHGECCDQGTLLAHIRNSGLEDAISAIGKRTSDGTPQGRRCLRKISCGKCNDVTHPGASRPCPRCSGRAAGFYDASTGEITLCGYPSPDRLRHELQHAYQCRKAPPCGTTQNDNDCFMLIKMEIASYICGGDDYFGPPNACSDVSTDAGRRDCASAVVNAYVGLNAPFEERIHYPCRKMCAGFYSFDSTINRWAVPDAILNTLVEFIRTPGFHCATTPQQPNE